MKIKNIVPVCLIVCHTFVASAQDSSKSYSPDQQAKCYAAHFEKEISDPFSISFQHVYVHDVRPDTTKVGYFNSDITQSLHKVCVTPGEFNSYFQSFLSADHKNASYDLDIFITRGWISSEVKDRPITFTAELFLRNGSSFHPLYKFDSIIVEDGRPIVAIHAFQELMRASLLRLSNITFEHKLKKALSQADIDSRYDPSRYDFVKPSNKGVYMSIDEFKSDRPSYTDFQVRYSKLTDELFVKEEDGYVLTRQAWGYFDGKVLFISVGDNYFPVDIEGSAMNFFAASKLKKEHKQLQASPQVIGVGVAVMNNFVLSKKRKLVKLKAYQLNTLTGEIY